MHGVVGWLAHRIASHRTTLPPTAATKTTPTSQSMSLQNQSLSELACVVSAMKQTQKQGGKKAAGGFRDSALTALLRSSLGGDCKVRSEDRKARRRWKNQRPGCCRMLTPHPAPPHTLPLHQRTTDRR